MKSQINLLHSEFKPQFEWICGSHFLGLVMLVCVFSGITYGGIHYWQSVKEEEVAAIKANIKAKQDQMNELTAALTAKSSDPVLENKLKSLIVLTQSRSTLLNQIRSLSELKQRSFSTLFDSFSKAHSDELWLTNFLVTPTELTIKGQIVKPRALPVWISQLSQTEFFAGQEFDNASVERENDVLIFTLNSKAKVLKSPELAKLTGAPNARD